MLLYIILYIIQLKETVLAEIQKGWIGFQNLFQKISWPFNKIQIHLINWIFIDFTVKAVEWNSKQNTIHLQYNAVNQTILSRFKCKYGSDLVYCTKTE